MDSIETFLALYPATTSTIAAAATVGAVIVALYLARRPRPRLRVFANINRYISPEAQRRAAAIDLNEAPRMIAVTIANVGSLTVSISYWSSFVWSVPGGKKVAAQNPAEPDFRSQPIELLPGKSVSIVLSHDLPGHRAMMLDLAATSRFGTWSLRFPRLTVSTEIGDRFQAKIGVPLRQFTRGQ